MGSVSTIYNGVRTWLAGRALMDVALSDRSTNGVQNKIIKAKFDEVDDSISQLNSDLDDLFIVDTVDIPYTVPANQRFNSNLFTAANVKTGYTPFGVVGFSTNNYNVHAIAANLIRNDYSCYLSNTGSTSVTASFAAWILYKKN